ncbi:hypothetical protein CPB83DRAFT_810497 [Crepidotus variabilis]|uniref:F-box domain-containing protein n=1 Tax=Crepidotus variabilis TaxID=179855 RepID=A0A9P6JSJ7_9AGAR|nr:hypothetical protein CPB83DRAFT_810497 [Crepidotus variabilis]
MTLRPTFLGLPIELLTDLMKQLESTDILHLRQTCKHLFGVSHERSIWLYLIYYYLETIQPRAHWPDQSIHLYNSKQLELMVLQPFKVKRRWTIKNIKPSLNRPIKLTNKAYVFHLVTGGRRLLLANIQGKILCIDLDAPKSRARTLIPSLYGTKFRVITRISVDMDDKTLSLAFNITVKNTFFELDEEICDPLDGLRPIQIWRVTTAVDKTGFANGSTAQHLAFFYEEAHLSFHGFVLYKSLVAYSVTKHIPDSDDWPLYAAVVVPWAKASTQDLSYERMIIRTDTSLSPTIICTNSHLT